MAGQSYTSPQEVRRALRSLYRGDSEANLREALLGSLSDDVKPVDDKGRWKPSSALVLVAVLIAALAGIFLYFSFGVGS